MNNTTELPIGLYRLKDRTARACMMLNDLHDFLSAGRSTEPWADDPVGQACAHAKDLHAQVYTHWLTGEPDPPELVEEFIGLVMAADFEAQSALSMEARGMSYPERWARQLVAACWGAALNWGVSVEHQR